MEQLIPVVNQLVSSLTLSGQVIIAVVFLAFLFQGETNGSIKLIEKYGLHCIFLIALGATAVSLFYSNFANYAPCELCWWQRIFMYSILVVAAVGLWKKDRGVVDYILTLTILGGLVAIYNSYLQYGG